VAGDPQASTPQGPARDEKGRILPGQGSLNPSGQPAWVAEIREQLRQGLPAAAKTLAGIIDGTATQRALDRAGNEVVLDPPFKDRVAAVKVLFEFTLPKPKLEVGRDQQRAVPLAGMTREDLLAIALGKTPEK
jgi:hypothetical protein